MATKGERSTTRGRGRDDDMHLDHIRHAATIDQRLESRAVSFENPTGDRGRGGTTHGGRKGAPSRMIAPGERVTLADLDGPGTIRHIWLTVPPATPERLRALHLEARYDGASEPSIAVPLLDFFGLPHGRPVAYASALTTVAEGHGFNAYYPMPFREHVELTFVNHSDRPVLLYYQVDYTLEPELAADVGVLHVAFRRENPTTQRRDFVVVEGLRGPGRYLGCAMGVRVIDPANWYGEGEVKVYLDGDRDHPTICGTGLEDYVGTAWGLGPHHLPYGGAPLVLSAHGSAAHGMGTLPDLVGLYRWHLPDPIVYRNDLTVTVQQIGAMFFQTGQEDDLAAYERTNPVAGPGWQTDVPDPLLAWGICERVDDYCAAAFVYCLEPQPVPLVDTAAATADIERRECEVADPMEALFGP